MTQRTSAKDTLKLNSLELTNFRCFEHLTCTFDPRCTLFYGINGSGKTALLEAVVVGLGALFVNIDAFKVMLFRATDRRQVIREVGGLSSLEKPTPVSVRVDVTLNGKAAHWTVTPRSRQSLQGTHAGEWGRLTSGVAHRGKPIDLPVIVYYSASRLWNGHADPSDTELNSRLDAYAGCLTADTSLTPVATWMRRLTFASVQKRSKSWHLAAIRSAVVGSLPEIRDFFYDIEAEELRVRFGDGTLQSMRLLSDGYRTMIGIAADLAWRAAMLNPHHRGNVVKRVDGVVLIDEIDLHLHPTWQRRVLPSLVRTFPHVQFVATTHSPQVLASAKRTWTRTFNGISEVRTGGYVEGRDSNSILVDIMGDRSRPKERQDQLNEVLRLIDDEVFGEARAALEKLEKVWGPDDPEILRARALLMTLEAM